MTDYQALVSPLAEIGGSDVAKVGGKNASLGEMIRNLNKAGIRVPGGFATTAAAYWSFIEANDLKDKLSQLMHNLLHDSSNLAEVGGVVRKLILDSPIPPDVEQAILRSYANMRNVGAETVAVRSSATAEDLPEASFAGQLDTYLNVRGGAAVLDSWKKCFASLFTDRAIFYRETHGFDHLDIAVSVGVQSMVRSDLGCSGVMFSIDTETGFPGTVLITGAWGLGETVVQGMVEPDEFHVFKPLLDQRRVHPDHREVVGEQARRDGLRRGRLHDRGGHRSRQA